MKREIIRYTLKYIHLVKANTWLGQRTQVKFIYSVPHLSFLLVTLQTLIYYKKYFQKNVYEHLLCGRHCFKCLEYIRIFMNKVYKVKLYFR